MIDGGLRKIFKQAMPQGDWVAIETGQIAQGVPDANCCWSGKEFWVEYKSTRNYTVKFRPEQCGWIERRIRHGGKVFVAVRRTALAGPRRQACDELWLFNGLATRHLITGGLMAAGAAPLGRWPGGPGGWPWSQVAALLRQ